MKRGRQKRNIRNLFGAEVLGLLLEDELHQITLVFEGVTLGLQVEVVVPKRGKISVANCGRILTSVCRSSLHHGTS